MNTDTYCCTIEDLLTHMVGTEGSSDLILIAGRPPLVRRFGEIHPVDGFPPLTPSHTESLSGSLISKEQMATFREDKELDMSIEFGRIGRFRINVFRQRGTTSLVARRVMDEVPDFKTLGLPAVVPELAKLKKGLVLFTGPTGQGKSTSVASMIDYINRNRHCHIITIEDPIEYMHRHHLAVVEQREVGVDTNSFAGALRRVLRQAPDVIMIGEIRDRESAQAAMTLAETGHLILSTLHTSGAVASVNRLIDMFPAEQERQIRMQLSISLAAIIWQQLIPAKERNALVLACETMVAIPAIRSLIRQGRIHEVYSVIQTGRKHGMFTMDQAVDELMRLGKVDPMWFKSNYFDLANDRKKG